MNNTIGSFIALVALVFSACSSESSPGGSTPNDASADGVSCPNLLSSCNGLCVDLQKNVDHCGVCGKVCSAGELCVQGQCAVGCPANQSKCGGDAGPAYCSDLASDNMNCGACGKTCAQGESCVNKTCTAVCSLGSKLCSDKKCHDVLSDQKHCGDCDKACAEGNVCSNGGCCPYGQEYCSPVSSCVNTQLSAKHCGKCGNECKGDTPNCIQGTCSATPPRSCKDILVSEPTSKSGLYTIDPDGPGPETPLQVYCDMKTNGGGWTLILTRRSLSDRLGQPDLDKSNGTFNNLRNGNWNLNVNHFFSSMNEVLYAVRHQSECSNCEIGDYHSAVAITKNAKVTKFDKSCAAMTQAHATKVTGKDAGLSAYVFWCPAALGWGNCTGSVCHYGVTTKNEIADSAWGGNTPFELHFPSAYSAARNGDGTGGLRSCVSCSGAFEAELILSSTCCNHTNYQDLSYWTIWVR